MNRVLIAMVLLAGGAWADVSYNSAVKNSSGGAVTNTKTRLKGNKMKMDMGQSVTVMDFDAQTVTTLDTASKTYRVMPMAQISEGLEKAQASIQAKTQETGAKKVIRGMACRQVNTTMNVQSGAGPQGMAMVMEMETWVTQDAPGAAEMAAFAKRMAEKGLFQGAGGNQQMKKAMADIQREMAKINGVPVMQVIKMRMADDGKNAQMQAQMEQARAQMEALKKQGGPAAAQIEKALAAMGGGGKYMMEMTTEMSDFSLATIPAGEFAVPAGFKKQN
jgi:hypothetical protein